MKRLFLFVGLAACHQNCGDNVAEQYGHFLAPQAICSSIFRGDNPAGDWADCLVGSEEWVCHGYSQCNPLGPAVLVKRVQ